MNTSHKKVAKLLKHQNIQYNQQFKKWIPILITDYNNRKKVPKIVQYLIDNHYTWTGKNLHGTQKYTETYHLYNDNADIKITEDKITHQFIELSIHIKNKTYTSEETEDWLKKALQVEQNSD